jgi:serine/threonine-protein kinase
VLRCFLNGGYYFHKKSQFPVAHLKEFLRLLKTSTEEKNRIIFANLHTKLDALPRYSESEELANDVPF